MIGKKDLKRKAVLRSEVEVRLGKRRPRTSPLSQVLCEFTWPLFHHAYDADFVKRPDKTFGYYEHCLVCGRARSWVSWGNNYGRSEEQCRAILDRSDK